jgi:hypothetical protein
MKDNRKATAVVVPSQIEIIDTLPKDIQLRVYKALFNYELFDIEFDKDLLKNPVIQALWIMSKPLIDKRVSWAENGRKGGITKGKNSKSKANRKQTDSKQKADKDMELDMDMEMEYPYPSGGSPDAHSVGTDGSKTEDDDWDWDWSKVPALWRKKEDK